MYVSFHPTFIIKYCILFFYSYSVHICIYSDFDVYRLYENIKTSVHICRLCIVILMYIYENTKTAILICMYSDFDVYI